MDFVFQDVEARTFEKFPNLKELDLSNNEITIIRADAFLGLSYLMYLNLSHNRLSNVAGIFNSLSKLKTLDISWNFIKVISLFTCNIHCTSMLYHLLCVQNSQIRR